MLLKYLICIALPWFSHPGSAQEDSSYTPAPEGITVVDRFSGDQGYYVFYQGGAESQTLTPVVFLHGFGALNPMIYGGWIRHLAAQGHVVIYPRYQVGLFTTSPDDFVGNTAAAVRSALTELAEQEVQVEQDKMYLIGHSYGGVISANLAVTWKDWELPEPKVALLCEPGSGPLRGGVLDVYDGMSADLQLIVIVGEDDQTVGQKFGRMVFESAVNTPMRALLFQKACSHETHEITASHYEPYAPDMGFDNGIENITSKRAERYGKLDQVDLDGYWKIFRMLVARTRSAASGAYSQRELDIFAQLGTWPDDTPVCEMQYHTPGDSGSR